MCELRRTVDPARTELARELNHLLTACLHSTSSVLVHACVVYPLPCNFRLRCYETLGRLFVAARGALVQYCSSSKPSVSSSPPRVCEAPMPFALDRIPSSPRANSTPALKPQYSAVDVSTALIDVLVPEAKLRFGAEKQRLQNTGQLCRFVHCFHSLHVFNWFTCLVFGSVCTSSDCLKC